MQTFLTIVSIVLSLTTVAVAWVQASRSNAAFDAQRALYESQHAAIWQEGYTQGIEDERTAAEHNTGTYEKVSANRANPYATEAGAR